MPNPLIALLTDFGNRDFFVASLKAVIAAIHPAARTIDITHEAPPFDPAAAGFLGAGPGTPVRLLTGGAR
jgi:S-adenosylmethionine hydrolase